MATLRMIDYPPLQNEDLVVVRQQERLEGPLAFCSLSQSSPAHPKAPPERPSSAAVEESALRLENGLRLKA